MDLNLAEHEPTVLEYARFHGLCRDYTQDQPYNEGICAPSDDAIYQDLKDPTVNQFEANISRLTQERLTVNRDTALVLKDIHSLEHLPEAFEFKTDERRTIRGLKLELPILKTDNDLDLINFGSTTLPDLTKSRIPSESVDNEKDEGLEWPSKYFSYPTQCAEKINAEKLGMTKDVLLFLQNAIKDAHSCEDYEAILDDITRHRPKVSLRPLTPPLLPLSPPLTPYVPSSPANRLELLSEDTDSTEAERKILEERIMATDNLSDREPEMLKDIVASQNFSPLSDIKPSPILKRRADQLKVEGPLTPPSFSESSLKKVKVSFDEVIREIPRLTWSDGKEKGDAHGSDDSRDEFIEMIEPKVKELEKILQNEKLIGADTVTRVDVPDLSFSLPTAPWDEFSRGVIKSNEFIPGETELDSQSKFIARVKRNDLKHISLWQGLSVPERELPWPLFSTEAVQVPMDGSIHGQDALNEILLSANKGSIATSAGEIWKPEGLRILQDNDDSDDEIEPLQLREHKGTLALAQKRKLQMDEKAESSGHTGPEVPFFGNASDDFLAILGKDRPSQSQGKSSLLTINQQSKKSNGKREKSRKSKIEKKPLKPTNSDDNSLMFGGFSAAMAANQFMKLHGHANKPPELDAGKEDAVHQIPSFTRPLTMPETTPQIEPREVAQAAQVTQLPRPDQAQPKTSMRKLPSLPRELPACSLIVSNSLLKRRTLMKELESIYQEVNIIYRDFDQPQSPAKDADILLSPSTGVILTTLQQVRQRALPGQPDQSPVKENVLQLQRSFERLVVIVSEGLSHEESCSSSRPVDPRDRDLLARFEEFASQLEGEVLVSFIGGGEHSLARIIVKNIARYALPHGSKDIGDIKPLADETNWELFLRRAGVNAYAAQVILASLKEPVQVPSPSAPRQTISLFGLMAFIFMSAEERVQAFQAIMGGSRVLGRVSAVLDQQWISAANGFRMDFKR